MGSRLRSKAPITSPEEFFDRVEMFECPVYHLWMAKASCLRRQSADIEKIRRKRIPQPSELFCTSGKCKCGSRLAVKDLHDRIRGKHGSRSRL